jgi:sigma-E factor negative regulatory protein RseA
MSTDPNTHEQLSALADGELRADEARFLLRRIESDPELAARWQRYHVVRACLRRESVVLADGGFAAAVAARVGQQVAPAAQRPWLRAALGGAIAAGVAVVALMATAPPVQGPDGMPILSEVAPLRTDDLAARLPAQRVSDRAWAPLAASGTVDPQVEGYFLRHSGAAAAVPRGGFLPYVYVVATPSDAAPIPRRTEAAPNSAQ